MKIIDIWCFIFEWSDFNGWIWCIRFSMVEFRVAHTFCINLNPSIQLANCAFSMPQTTWILSTNQNAKHLNFDGAPLAVVFVFVEVEIQSTNSKTTHSKFITNAWSFDRNNSQEYNRNNYSNFTSILKIKRTI